MMTIEKCAYKIYGMEDDDCIENDCNGYPTDGCFRYTTKDHLEDFDNLFTEMPLHPRVRRFYEKWGRKYQSIAR